MASIKDQGTIDRLTGNWIWVPDWADCDSSNVNTAGRIITFSKRFRLATPPSACLLHFSADTRYKLYINGKRVAIGPTRGSPLSWWYYDTLDIASYLRSGENEISFMVLRYFAATRAAMPFERTLFPGLTAFGSVEEADQVVSLDTTAEDWQARIIENIRFPIGLIDDAFLHINERVSSLSESQGQTVAPKAYNLKPLNGDLAPWRLRPRPIPMPEETVLAISAVRACNSGIAIEDWTAWLSGSRELTLPPNSSHTLDLQVPVHSTAFLRWEFRARARSQIRLKVTYSEGYECEPRSYPYFRSKGDRLDAENGYIIGPYDDVISDAAPDQRIVYEPFWFRTFRVLKAEITVGNGSIDCISFEATQVNYPLAVRASWKEPGDHYSEKMWEVSIRTLRNCMFDGYSDCPFYEQLQYAGDSRQVGLFHYLLSGDDRLMRQAIANFAASVTPEGLTQSRFPSHVPQIIAGFSLFWILQICDHHLFFGDTRFARAFLPRIDGVLDFFHAHLDKRGLVSNLPNDVWQYVDWVASWGATDEHPDKGVPTAGRRTNLHTYFSLLYGYTLKQAAELARQVCRSAQGDEYAARAVVVLEAVRKHCYDGQFFTDTTSDIAKDDAYSQHCQVFAVLSGAVGSDDGVRLLLESFASDPSRHFSRCSYMMQFYAMRAFSLAGDEAYETLWAKMWKPWHDMLANNLTTWEEDDVRQRSDCHAWGSVPIYEYCTELAGLWPLAPGFTKVLFKPRLLLSREIEARVCLGKDNLAMVQWKTQHDGTTLVDLRLHKPVELISMLPGDIQERDNGVVGSLSLLYRRPV